MDFTDEKTVWIAYAISNLAGLFFLITALRTTKLTRLLFVLLFGWASVFNYITCHRQPENYLFYSDASIGLYAQFIQGWFKDHITGFVSFIALGQAFIAIGMLFKGWLVQLACMGAIVFLLAIAPLGIYAGFPFSLTVSAAAFQVFRNDNLAYLWKFKMGKVKHTAHPTEPH